MRVAQLAAACPLVVGLLAAVPAGRVAAASPPCPSLGGTQLTQSQSFTPAGGNPVVVCNDPSPNRVRSFDGTPIDLDVTLPTVPYVPAGSTTPAASPLVIMMSGWSNDICQFESTSLTGTAVSGCQDYIGNPGYHWNNAWFASRGFVTITYTPRGWYESCGKRLETGYTYLNDSTCSDTAGEQSWVHLYDRRFEIRDAQYLAGLVVDAMPSVDPNHVVATGDSGGGGPSWDLGLSSDQVVQLNSTPANIVTAPWQSPSGTPLHLAAAVPMYTWTDLVDALVSNGRASDGFHTAPADGDRQSPVGVEKESYVTGLFAKGLSDVPGQPEDSAQFSTPCPTNGTPCNATTCPSLHCDPSADLTNWYAEINAGEPSFSANPNTPAILAQIGGALRSPYSVSVPLAHEIPIYSIQGLTDPLFPGLQTITMVNRLKAADPNYPVWAFLGDVGHSYATNPLNVWQDAHAASNAWLDHALNGTLTLTSQQPVIVDNDRCLATQPVGSESAASFDQLTNQLITFGSTAPQTISSSTTDTEGPRTDPIANSGCRTIPASQSDPGQAVYTTPVGQATLVGSPVVHASAAVTGSSAELAARLWEVDSSGNQTLISRTVYRIDNGVAPSANLTLVFELSPNAWAFTPGDTVKLELTQDDNPVWRPDNEPSTITLSNVSVVLPVLAGQSTPPPDVPEAPVAALLPLGGLSLAGAAFAVGRRRRRQR